MSGYDLRCYGAGADRGAAQLRKRIKRSGSRLGLLTLPWLLLMADHAAAQDDGEVIEEIQVTATRRPAELSEVSAALTIITADDIARAKVMTDALAFRPGVFLQQTTPGQGAAIVRGLKGSEVLHLVDGMRLNNAIFRNAPTQYMSLVAPGTLDRIEVVRGAPASLYGSDAVGGVVQALSRIPSFDAPGSRGDAYLGFDTADLTNVVRAAGEFGNEKVAALISGEYLETGNRRIGGGLRVGPSGYVSKGGRIAVAATPDENQSWLFDLHAARQPMTPRVDELVPGFGQTEPSSSEFFFAPNDRVFAHVRHSRDEWLLDATWTFDLGWQKIVDDRISRDYLSDVRTYDNNSSDLIGFTANASGESAAGSWIAGVEFYHDEVGSSRYEENTTAGSIEVVASRFPDGATMDQAAIFGNYARHLGQRHLLSAGLRFSAIGTDLPPSFAAPAASVEQDDISADLGWVFDVLPETQLTANIGYGFRAPNVFDLGTLGERPGTRFNIPNPDLESERVTQFDVGLRHPGEHWDLDIVLFALHYADRITSVLTGDVTAEGRAVTQSRNVESADIYGIEVSGHFIFSKDLSAGVVMNYLRGEQSDASGPDVPGDRIPPLNGRVSLAYQATQSLLIEPYVEFAAEQDRLSPRDVQDPRIDPVGTPGWMTANIRMTLAVSDDWYLLADFSNLLDKRYRTHGSGIDAAGRNLYVALQAEW